MTVSIWRYSHLALAVSSFLFLTLASVTGVILAFQPVIEKSQPYRVDNFNEIKLSESLPVIRETYPGISELTVDANSFVSVKGSDNEGNELSAYIDPHTGKILGKVEKPNEFFQWVTALHRSLFLHLTGRFFIGLTAFLLILIALSGIILVIQRQRGVRRFFTRIVKENFAQYYHVVLGRLMLVPILIIALTGTYISLNSFEIVPATVTPPEVDFDNIKSGPVKDPKTFEIFTNTLLSEVKTIEFPFSEDPEDYYTLKLNDRVVTVNQVTGDILSEKQYPVTVILSKLSLDLHTGKTNAFWAIVLAIASCNILFFIYSGFLMTFRRRANLIKNKFAAKDSRFIILVGSENGSSFLFANAIHHQLIKQGEKSFIGELNSYMVYPEAEYLLIFASTYGLGEAPTNASRFVSLLEKHPQPRPVHYSVLGFGSRAYKDFCKFAFDVDHLLSGHEWAVPLLGVHTVDDKSPGEFNLWAEAWSQKINMPVVTIQPGSLAKDPSRLETFTVTDNVEVNDSGGTFLIRLKLNKRKKVTSGDLLAIYPAGDHRERLYSIGKIREHIQLSVRIHTDGLGSGYLHRLKPGEKIRARVVRNPHFYFPEKKKEVIMISNGTGIAPFLGMIDQNKTKITCHLYCGFRNTISFEMYKEFLVSNQNEGQLGQLHVAFSREDEKQYVSDLITRDADLVSRVLENQGILMICGSLAMQKDVLNLIDTICREKSGKGVSHYQSHDQILTDCY
ncbi:FAD-binding oxidoreductase [Emticicia sp. CRIBPO]|uniref:PepSY domain-containing protein n=1 Tax=Emticicia sp. CRIBPO TaxID=2683258 RepID=UPI001412E836|nr:PepSY domain-containing protein [Emticicia sp. CRIBPO]NBA88888.1 FAD-binding oxidoreductase [Emticicia sp. CRIBPO]